MMKKILIISGRCGTYDTRIRDIASGLAGQGYAVDILAGRDAKDPEPEDDRLRVFGMPRDDDSGKEPGQIRIFRSGRRHFEAGSFGSFLDTVIFPAALRFKAVRLKKNRYDAILVYQDAPVAIAGAAYAAAAGKRRSAGSRSSGKTSESRAKDHTSVTIYAIDIWPQKFFSEMDIRNGLLKKIFTGISQRNYRRADHIVCLSTKAADHFIKDLHIHAGRVDVIPLCPERFREEEKIVPQLLERYAGSFNVVYAGPVDRHRDFETVCKAAAMIYKNGIRNIRFIIAGWGDIFGELERKTARSGLQDAFFFEKIRPDELSGFTFIADALLACTVFAEDDDYHVATEVSDHMAAKRPIISMTGSEEKHLVYISGCGVSASPGNALELSEGIIRLYRAKQSELEKMAENAGAWQKEHFSRDENIRKLALIISDSAGMHGSDSGMREEEDPASAQVSGSIFVIEDPDPEEDADLNEEDTQEKDLTPESEHEQEDIVLKEEESEKGAFEENSAREEKSFKEEPAAQEESAEQDGSARDGEAAAGENSRIRIVYVDNSNKDQ